MKVKNMKMMKMSHLKERPLMEERPHWVILMKTSRNLKLQNMSQKMKLVLQRKELALGPLAVALSEEIRYHGGK